MCTMKEKLNDGHSAWCKENERRKQKGRGDMQQRNGDEVALEMWGLDDLWQQWRCRGGKQQERAR
ncbi:hypothetical protein BDQ17DRAFT_1370707 [Cyathus striatus]|nr:hypothetical protein BDQ17DRAFT_1370707 [Cyathus striatus]